MPRGVRLKDAIVPKPYPKEFRADVVCVVESREPGVTIERITAHFGGHPMPLTKWLARSRKAIRALARHRVVGSMGRLTAVREGVVKVAVSTSRSSG